MLTLNKTLSTWHSMLVAAQCLGVVDVEEDAEESDWELVPARPGTWEEDYQKITICSEINFWGSHRGV